MESLFYLANLPQTIFEKNLESCLLIGANIPQNTNGKTPFLLYLAENPFLESEGLLVVPAFDTKSHPQIRQTGTIALYSLNSKTLQINFFNMQQFPNGALIREIPSFPISPTQLPNQFREAYNPFQNPPTKSYNPFQ